MLKPKKNLIRLNLGLWTIFLNLSCASLPPQPEIFQCAYTIKFDKFRCVNNVTKVAINLKRSDPAMEAAQCLSADDYKKTAEWVDSVIQIANQHCH